MSQKGFTLIEMMSVVAIIGVIAAFALPLYQNYVAKAQVSEATVLFSGLKMTIPENISDNGVDVGCSLPVSSVISGRYVETITIDGVPSNTSCRIRIKFRDSDLNSKVIGKSIWFVYNSSIGDWTCETNLSAEVKPVWCSLI